MGAAPPLPPLSSGVPCLGMGFVGAALSALWTAVPGDSGEGPGLRGSCPASRVLWECQTAGGTWGGLVLLPAGLML